MLVGGSSICVADEITSGLDPISRRVIWEVIKSERSRRTMVPTTHFLDESEVLSDHIIIVTLGEIKMSGAKARAADDESGVLQISVSCCSVTA
jgi:ABC-type multidrug transport system ATPase subunit